MTINTPPSSATPQSLQPPHAEKEDFRMYHEQQYERMSQLEQQRLTVTNFVLGFSILSFTIGFDDLSKLNIINGVCLPIVIIATNIFSMMYASKSRDFVKMHQARADKARDMFAPELNQINRSVGKIDSNKDLFNRTRLQQYLHLTFVVVSIFTLVLYIT